LIIRIKICCISSFEEAMLAIKYGANALGFVSTMPSGAGIIDEKLIPEIVAAIPPPTATFLLTSLINADDIVAQIIRCRTNTVQLVDRVEKNVYQKIKEKLPWIKIVQVIHINGEDSIEESKIAAQFADALLLDSGNQSLSVKELGGTGRTHDWGISKRICASVNKPIFLAGGLNPFNIEEAINSVHPFGVDVCSGLRTDNRLDKNRLKDFIEKVKKVEREIQPF
jgi:phosphoribosylanthranilate isomerase